MHELDDSLDIRISHRRRLAIRSCEIADARCLSHKEPSVIINDHLDHQIAGIELALNDALFARPGKFHDVFGRN